MRNDAARAIQSRTVVATVVAIVAVVAFASLGGVGLAKSAIGLAQYQYGKKATICHKGKRTITVSVKAVPAHLRHGDVLGTCAAAAAKANKGKHNGESHHAANPATGSGATTTTTTTTSHGNSSGKGQGHGKNG